MRHPYDGYLAILLANGLTQVEIRETLANLDLRVAGDFEAHCDQLRDIGETSPAWQLHVSAYQQLWDMGPVGVSCYDIAAGLSGPADLKPPRHAGCRGAHRILGYQWMRDVVEVLTMLGVEAEEIARELQNMQSHGVTAAMVQAYHDLFWAPDMTPQQICAWLTALPKDVYPHHRMLYTSSPSQVRAQLGLPCSIDLVAMGDQVVVMSMAVLRRSLIGGAAATPAEQLAGAQIAQGWFRLVTRSLKLAMGMRRDQTGADVEGRGLIVEEVLAELERSDAAVAPKFQVERASKAA
ncbi:MAG: hypothetical protein O2782_17795 [bacterium]|nr:hypothetical protein [bacterium]